MSFKEKNVRHENLVNTFLNLARETKKIPNPYGGWSIEEAWMIGCEKRSEGEISKKRISEISFGHAARIAANELDCDTMICPTILDSTNRYSADSCGSIFLATDFKTSQSIHNNYSFSMYGCQACIAKKKTLYIPSYTFAKVDSQEDQINSSQIYILTYDEICDAIARKDRSCEMHVGWIEDSAIHESFYNQIDAYREACDNGYVRWNMSQKTLTHMTHGIYEPAFLISNKAVEQEQHIWYNKISTLVKNNQSSLHVQKILINS